MSLELIITNHVYITSISVLNNVSLGGTEWLGFR